MSPLKRIAASSVAGALERALRYRLLNEPREAESICCDILDVEPENQEALMILLLARTDQFDTELAHALDAAKEAWERLRGEYERAYYEGIIHERWAHVQRKRNLPADVSVGWYLQAMRCFERAESLAPADNPDAVLRWNSCARMIDEQRAAEPPSQTTRRDVHGEFGDDVPLRNE